MKYFSTRDTGRLRPASFSDVVLQGLAPDGGLYMPAMIPRLTGDSLRQLEGLSLAQVAWLMLYPYVSEELKEEDLAEICQEVFNFPLPLVQLNSRMRVLELFHGPTLAFKDFGARFMARILSRIALRQGLEVKVVVATSGDTGSAVAAGFYKVQGIRVYILYPKGRVSPGQQKQLTTWGGNITALEIDGNFDDCQRHVKALLADESLKGQILLTSANSINLARLLPQMVYYAYAYAETPGKELVFSVPSGNFGNLTAGLMASAMGIPIKHFVAATNANKVVPAYLNNGIYKPAPSVPTLSNAMDVGNPSNFERMLHVYGHSHPNMVKHLSGADFSDEQTLVAMQELYSHYGYVADPHGAVGYLGLKQRLAHDPDAQGIFLETAHPSKFPDTVQRALGNAPEIPSQLEAMLSKDEIKRQLPNDYAIIRSVCAAT